MQLPACGLQRERASVEDSEGAVVVLHLQGRRDARLDHVHAARKVQPALLPAHLPPLVHVCPVVDRGCDLATFICYLLQGGSSGLGPRLA